MKLTQDGAPRICGAVIQIDKSVVGVLRMKTERQQTFLIIFRIDFLAHVKKYRAGFHLIIILIKAKNSTGLFNHVQIIWFARRLNNLNWPTQFHIGKYSDQLNCGNTRWFLLGAGRFFYSDGARSNDWRNECLRKLLGVCLSECDCSKRLKQSKKYERLTGVATR